MDWSWRTRADDVLVGRRPVVGEQTLHFVRQALARHHQFILHLVGQFRLVPRREVFGADPLQFLLQPNGLEDLYEDQQKDHGAEAAANHIQEGQAAGLHLASGFLHGELLP